MFTLAMGAAGILVALGLLFLFTPVAGEDGFDCGDTPAIVVALRGGAGTAGDEAAWCRSTAEDQVFSAMIGLLFGGYIFAWWAWQLRHAE